MSGRPDGALREELAGSVRAQGFQRAACVRSRDLPETLLRHPAVEALGEGSYLLAAFSCHRREADDLSTPGDPHARIAPFARRNYYREAAHRLKQVLARWTSGPGEGRPSKARVRIFCNSRLPERALAAAAGLGFRGRNSLLIAPRLGSAFLIAGLFLPVDLGPSGVLDGDPVLGEGCGSCQACRQACPVGAIPEPGRVDPARCLSALSVSLGDWPEGAREAWGARLYGCQSCQEVCPYNRGLTLETATGRGELGPSLSLRRLLACDPEGLEGLFRGTALDMSWIPEDSLRRNALLAAGHRADAALLPLVEPHRFGPHPAVREAALWAGEVLRRG